VLYYICKFKTKDFMPDIERNSPLPEPEHLITESDVPQVPQEIRAPEEKGHEPLEVPEHIFSSAEEREEKEKRLDDELAAARLAGAHSLHKPKEGTTHEVPSYVTPEDGITTQP
jgi:hypothetical protein